MPEPAAHYTVLARRFRPQTFEDVVGQEHVGQALRNAIKAGRVAHAYLFTGARGVGKTSTARIFAKALNCPHIVDGVPCNECDICQSISAGQDVDVLEIDGASNRGIDDIRQLRANVNVKSMRSKFKVYIIDEVHMLTKEAFNALLKTLEEPPPNVKFVFCTTEPNKVPDTILSRCQRFDFGTIASGSIAVRLSQIADAEGIQVDEEAIELVARRAAGSMRDSQSLFDQLLAFGEEHITAADVHKLLGTAPDDRLIELAEALIRRDRLAALAQLDEALNRGVQLGPFSDQLLEYLRDLLILLAGANDLSLQSVGNSQREVLTEQGSRWGLHTVTAAMQILAETKGRMSRVNYGRALLELALVRISLLEDLDQIGQLIARMAGGGGPGTVSPAPARTGPASGTPGRPASGPASRPAATARPSDAMRNKLQGASTVPKPDSSLSSTASPPVASFQEDRDTSSHSRPSMIGADVDDGPAPSMLQNATATGTATAELTAESPHFPDTAASTVTELTADTADILLSQLLTELPDTITNHLKNARNLAISAPDQAEIVFPISFQFSMNYCQRPETLRQIRDELSRTAGRTVDIRFRTVGTVSPAAPSEPRRRPADDERLRPKAVEQDPFIQQVATLFGATVVNVRRILAEPLPTAETATVNAGDETGPDLDDDMD